MRIQFLSRYSFVLLLAAVLLVAETVPGFPAREARAQVAGKFYGGKISLPAEPGERLQSAAADAAAALKAMTGREYSVDGGYTGPGIHLLRLAAPEASQAPADAAARLKDKGLEAFVIQSGADDVLRIVSATDAGLGHGLYFYLEQLGIRYLFPNDNWTIIPRRKDVALKIDRVVAPDFRSRDFFGTGGFGPGTPVDPKLAMRARWDNWKRRNRFGEEYFLGGHTGEAFNAAHKAILLEHPEYLAKVDGKHVPWSPSAKLNVANAAAVKLYVDWTVERFRKARAENPNYFAVSVDPADSGGHCNSEECKKIGSGSVSDMVYYVANEAAKAVRREFPDGWVSLLAYNAHASVPTIALEPNIYVKVVPYAFQSTGLSPEEMIRAWGRKVRRMSIYDYWAITDWAQNQPNFNYVSTPAAKLRLWKQNNIEGFRGESTYSAGAMGPGWYVASRLMWDVGADEKAIVEEFYTLAFGPAKAPMKRLLERWATDYQLNPNQLGMAYRDLREARKLAAADAAVMARLDDYGRYLHYLRLWSEFQGAAAGSPERTQAAGRVLAYIWDIYDSAMVQTTRTAQLMINRYAPDPELKAHFDYKNKKAPFWKDVSPVTAARVEELLAEGEKAYPILFQPAFFALTDLKPLTAEVKGPEANVEDNWVTTPTRFGTAEFAVWRGPQNGPDTGEVQLLAGRGTLKARVTVVPPGGGKPSALEVGAGDWTRLPVGQGPGVYRIRVQPVGTFSYLLRAKPQACLTALESVEVRKPADLMLFYVPPGQKTIALSVPGGTGKKPMTILNGDGRPVELNAGLLKIIPVPAGQDGKVWSLRGHAGNRNQKIMFLNGPRVYGFSRAGMLVPANPVALDAPARDVPAGAAAEALDAPLAEDGAAADD